MTSLHASFAADRLSLFGESPSRAPRPLSFPETARLLAKVSASDEDGRPLGADLSAADDLKVFAALWRFAADAIAAGQVVPSIEDGRSRWVAMLDAADRRGLRRLCARMPDGAGVARRFFDFAVDSQIRFACASSKSLFTEKGSPSNLHSALLASLSSSDPALRWNGKDDLQALGESLKLWRMPAGAPVAAVPSLAFRVLDPSSGRGVRPLWKVFPVVVSGDKGLPLSTKLLRELDAASRLRILLSLSQAIRVAPDLAEAELFSGTCRVVLDAAGFNAFMTAVAPKLGAAGFPVLAPRWWKPPSERRISIHAEVSSSAGRIRAFSLDSLLDVKWKIVLDGTGLTEKELRWIAENDSSVAKIGGSWMNIDRDAVARAKSMLDELSSGGVSVRDLVKIGMGFSGTPDVAVELDRDSLPDGAGKLLETMSGSGKIARVPVPAALSGELRPYQRDGLDWLTFLRRTGFGACLADDMGLGKTIETLSAILAAREDGESGPVLVVCPMSIMLKWFHETKRFAPSLSVWVYHGQKRPHGLDFSDAAKANDICITSYDMLTREFASFSSVRWGIVAVDEAQNIKNPQTAKSRAARSLNASWRIAITGTPIENGIGDIWAIMDFLNRGLLPDKAAFERRFGAQVQKADEARAQAELRRIVSPFVLRRLKTDPDIAAGLPPKVEEKVYCRIAREQATAYAAEASAAEREIGGKSGIARRGAILALITRLKEICDYPGFEEEPRRDASDPLDPARSGKLERLDEMLGAVIEGGEAALVFTQYARFGHLLARHLSVRFGFDVPFLHGGVPAHERERMVAEFQADGGPGVFVISIRAGGIGFNLTRANHIFHYDRWWNPATENQATDRAHRIGQSKTVFVHTFICDGTLESRIDDLISEKREVAENIVEGGSGWLANLDDDRLREVIALSARQ